MFRALLFFVGCIGLRSVLEYVAKTARTHALPWLGLLALLPAFGFFFIYLTGARKTGPEVFGEPIWWNALRPVHGTLYLLFAISAIFRLPDAWMFLLLDVILGVLSYTAVKSGIY
jgi:hypothetical protein